MLVTSRLQLFGDVEALLDSHHRLVGPRRAPANLPANQHLIEASHTDRQSTLLVRSDDPILDPAWTVEQVGMEDLVLAYMSQAASSRTPSGQSPRRVILGVRR